MNLESLVHTYNGLTHFPLTLKRSPSVRDAFRWSPTRGLWIRLLNNAARYAAQDVANRISREG